MPYINSCNICIKVTRTSFWFEMKDIIINFPTMYILHGNTKVYYLHNYAYLSLKWLNYAHNGIQLNYANYATIKVINYY